MEKQPVQIMRNKVSDVLMVRRQYEEIDNRHVSCIWIQLEMIQFDISILP
jgi:hypothetical protein